MAIAVEKFGEHEGRRIDQFRLASESGVDVDILSYGVVVRDWRVPVAGGARSVVLGFEDFASYPAHSPYFGALAGPVANRIAGASFEIDGVRHHTPANWNGHTLHGGPEGLGQVVWDAEIDSARNAVRFTLVSPDGRSGFPGNVAYAAVYSLRGNRLRLELSATTDRKTPINVVQHQYFNLGTGPDVLDHRFQLRANAYTETGPDLIPTGSILPVAGTQYDLRQPRTLRDAAGQPLAYDMNFVLNGGRDTSEPVAIVAGPDGALTLRLWTDQPGLQFYNAVYTEVPVPGLGGRRYGQYSGFCLEDQAFPDAVHHPHFPSVWYAPERPYAHWCEIEIG